MAASMWRMNGLWRRMAGVLVLCALLLSSEVMCQDEDAVTGATDAPAPDTPADASAVPEAAGSTAAPAASDAPAAGGAPTVAPGDSSAPSDAPGDVSLLVTSINMALDLGRADAGTSGTTAAPVPRSEGSGPVAEVTEDSNTVKFKPDVKCVGKDDISESHAVKVEVTTDDCEATKRLIDENLDALCKTQDCELKIFQDDKTVLMTSDNAPFSALADAVQGEQLKNKLGVTKVDTPPSSSGSSVFVGILVSGLLAALALVVGYFRCQRRTDTKGVRLAEEAYPVDQENQGNTLVSVAPLNPPPETTEKPSVNGESPEAAKTQPPPPTNGHSTAKTADTEL